MRGYGRDYCLLQSSILGGFKNCTISSTCTESNEDMAAAVASGIPCSLTVAWVIMPNVPGVIIIITITDYAA